MSNRQKKLLVISGALMLVLTVLGIFVHGHRGKVAKEREKPGTDRVASESARGLQLDWSTVRWGTRHGEWQPPYTWREKDGPTPQSAFGLRVSDEDARRLQAEADGSPEAEKPDEAGQND